MIEAIYTCGTCGLKIVDKQEKNKKVLEEKKFWHECSDGYVVPLQSLVEKIHEKTDHK